VEQEKRLDEAWVDSTGVSTPGIANAVQALEQQYPELAPDAVRRILGLPPVSRPAEEHPARRSRRDRKNTLCQFAQVDVEAPLPDPLASSVSAEKVRRYATWATIDSCNSVPAASS